jgi:CubicO group peptidase (beta-lactamase class C family)
LLAHSSGIPDYTEFRNFDATQANPTTREELIARFRSNPLQFSPGSAFRYSNSGYVLLGAILEYVTGSPYDDLLRNEITAPLGLNDTGYDHSRNGSDPSLAHGWLRRGVAADAIDASTLDAAGALYSTVDDLFRWDRALAEGRMLHADTLAMMRTPQIKRYGLGVMLYPLGNMPVVHHDGMASGMSVSRAEAHRIAMSAVPSNWFVSPSGLNSSFGATRTSGTEARFSSLAAMNTEPLAPSSMLSPLPSLALITATGRSYSMDKVARPNRFRLNRALLTPGNSIARDSKFEPLSREKGVSLVSDRITFSRD